MSWHCQILDLEKYFDTLDPCYLIEKAVEYGYPTTDLSIAMQQHLAPRVIQANGVSSNSFPVSKSILAGCKHGLRHDSLAALQYHLHLQH